MAAQRFVNNHPDGLAEGWWEDSLRSIIEEARAHFRVMANAPIIDNRVIDPPKHLRMLARIQVSLADAYQMAEGYVNQAQSILATAVDRDDKVYAILLLSRCTADLNAIARLVTMVSNGWTTKLVSELHAQEFQRKETLLHPIDLPDLVIGLEPWRRITEALEQAIRKASHPSEAKTRAALTRIKLEYGFKDPNNLLPKTIHRSP